MQGTLKIDVTANLTRLDADLNKASSLIQASIDAFGKRVRNAGKPIVLPVDVAPLGDRQRRALEAQCAAIAPRISQEMAQRWRESDQKYWTPRDEYVERVRVLQEKVNAGEISTQDQKEGIGKAQARWDASQPVSNLEQLGKQASEQLQKTFTDFLFDPFNAKVDDMVLNFLKAMQKMAAEAAAKEVFNAVSNTDLWKKGADWFKGSWNQSSQWISSGISTGASWLATLFAADGGVFDRGAHVAFAKGGAFTNGIVNRPTLFPFAKGAGLMGEAGPEAIMPLTRASNGSLGVRALLDVGGSGSGNVIQINTHINVEGSKAKSEDHSGDSDAASRQLSTMIADGAKSVVFKEQQPGGSIWRLVNGR